MQNFITKETRRFDELKEIIARYDDTAKQIPREIEKTEFIELFEVNRDHFINTLSMICLSIRDEVIELLINQYETSIKA